MLAGALVAGVCFAATQFFVSNFIGPYLTDILASIAAIAALLVLLRVWRPADQRAAEAALQRHRDRRRYACCAPGRPTSCW